MARNGSGTAAKAVSDFVAGNNISASDMNTLIDDIIDMLTQSISKDGQTTITGGLTFDGEGVASGDWINIDVPSSLNFTGQFIYARSLSNATDSRPLVEFINDSASATGAVVMKLQQDSTDYALEIGGGGTGTKALISGPSGASPLAHFAGNSLTSGGIIYARSNDTDTTGRYLIDSVNDNASATGAVCYRAKQDSTAPAIEIEKGTTDGGMINFSATADGDTTSAISTLTTSGSTTHHIQVEINGTKAWIAASTNNPS